MTSLSNKPVIQVTLSQLGIATENMRAGEDADDQIADLAETLKAGQIVPMLVRKGTESDLYDYPLLDGRRRFLAFSKLFQDGDIDGDHPINVIVCETAEEIAAAAVVVNTSRLDVTTADYLLAVHRLTSEFKTTQEVARIMGLTPKRVTQLARLGSVGPELIDLYRRKVISIDIIRAIARLDRPDLHAGFAEKARKSRLERSDIDAVAQEAIAADSNIAAFIDLKAYDAAGGQRSSDLFEQQADQLFDIPLVHKLWTAATAPIATRLKDQGLKVIHTVNAGNTYPKGTTVIPSWGFRSTSKMKERDEARDEVNGLASKMRDLAKAGDRTAYLAAVEFHALRSLYLARLKAQPLEIITCRMSMPRYAAGLELEFFVSEIDYNAYEQKIRAESAKPSEPLKPRRYGVAKVPDIHTENATDGYSKILHQRVTTVAGHALARQLAEHPAVALDLQIASQFQQAVLDGTGTDKMHRLLHVSASRQVEDIVKPDDMQKPVLAALLGFKQQFEDSGLHPFVWVQRLDEKAKFYLFGLITALQVSTFEMEPLYFRAHPRAQAAHVAKAMDHDIRDWWMPDAEFYAACSKKQLLGFLEAMGQDAAAMTAFARQKRGDLALTVLDLASKARWIPAAFNFTLLPPMETPESEADLDEEEVDDQDVDTFDDEEIGEADEVPA